MTVVPATSLDSLLDPHAIPGMAACDGSVGCRIRDWLADTRHETDLDHPLIEIATHLHHEGRLGPDLIDSAERVIDHLGERPRPLIGIVASWILERLGHVEEARELLRDALADVPVSACEYRALVAWIARRPVV